MNDIQRREFLARAAVLGGPLLLGTPLRAEAARDARIVRSKAPLNLEMPFGGLKEFLTPTPLHYVRNHYNVPELSAEKWALEVIGAVEKPLKLTYAQLKKMKTTTRAVTLECAGNGRALLPKKVEGVQWERGAVSTAEWAGVALADVLKLAGVKKGAVEVVLDGADRGDPKKPIQPRAPLSFCRSLPLAKALRPEVMLAYAMNGKPLPAAHGFPVRAVVPGWYGMASVKWLVRVIVTREPFNGFDQTIDYGYWRKGDDGLPRLVPVTQMQPKASFASPAAGAVLERDKEARLFGAAWAGESPVTRVEVSTDGGKTWRGAKLIDKATPFCWRRWELAWKPATAGKAVLKVRATDGLGQTQPTSHDAERRGYMINFVQSVDVTVK